MGMFGIIIMVIENELSSAGVYTKVMYYLSLYIRVYSFSRIQLTLTYCYFISGVNIFAGVEDAYINVDCDFTWPNRRVSRFRSTGNKKNLINFASKRF